MKYLDKCPALPDHISVKQFPRSRRKLEQLLIKGVVEDADTRLSNARFVVDYAGISLKDDHDRETAAKADG